MEDIVKYYASLSADERELLSRMYKLDDYFTDMSLRPDSIVRPYTTFKSQTQDGSWIDEAPDFWFGLFENEDFFVHIRDLPVGVAGCYNEETKEVSISPSEANNESVILHEMIHAYEHKLKEIAPYYRDIVMLCLYNDLVKKIPNLDSRIINHTHVIRADDITKQGGYHDVLFYLKSLDLDIRCGFPLGTVCGYGRTETPQEAP